MVSIVEDYLGTIEGYVQKRDKTSAAPVLRNETLPNIRIVVRETLRRLDALDAQRAGLQPATNAPTAAQFRAGP